MTDPFSTAASIITVLQLCASIAGCINTATGARKERERLLGEIRACEQIICKLKNHADGSEEDTAWLETVKALEAPDAPLGRLRIALSTVESKLRPKEGIQKTLASLKWPFSEKEVEKMFAAIEREKALLELALQNNSRKLIQEIKRTTTKNNTTLKDLIEAIRSHSSQTHGELLELKYGIDNIHNEQNQDKAARSRENIIKWLTRVDYAAQQSDYIARRQAGTGQWLLDSVEFTTWVESSKKTLFCPGIPGSGKTILTSIVIDNLMTRFSGNDTIGVAYLYCNYKQHSDQTAKYLLTDLLKQLTHRRLSLPDCVKSLYSKYEEQGKVAPSFDDISKTLQSVCRLYTKVFVAVDAIDECQKSDGHRSTLLKEIFALQAQNDVNIFATSRKIDEIAQMFVNSQSHEIRAQPEDVRRYVEGRISQLPSFVQRKPDLQEDIKNEIVKAVDGMFLLAQLHLDSLVGIRSPKAVRAALAKLPSGTFETYDEALKRIDAQVVDQVELAKQTLSWIVCAHRPLTTTELRHALAVEIGEPELDDENMSEIDDIISVCAGMVTVDIESDIVRLVHYTAQTFFASRQKEWLPHAQTDITRTCVAYLSFDVFEAGFSNSDEEFEERLRSNPLYDYAAHNWGHHARIAVTEAGHAINPKLPGPGQARNFENPDATQQIILTLFSNSNKLFASNQTLFARKWNGRRYYTEVPTRFTPIHTASYFGLEDIVVSLLQQNLDPNARDSYGRTPLWVAAQNGHGMVVETLLRTVGVEPDSKDLTFGATPLFKAAEAGYYKIVELLLAQESVDPISKDKYGQTPLLVAAGAGHYEIVELFLAKGVDPISKDKFGKTPLYAAVEDGYYNIVKLLLAKGIDPDSKNKDGETPLYVAAGTGYYEIVKLLLAEGVNPNSKDKDGQTPLYIAAEAGCYEIVKLLLARGVDPDSKNKDGQTPLYIAAETGHYEIVKQLLAKGADPESKDEYGQTPLHIATEKGYYKIVKLLLAKGVDPISKDEYGLTPLHLTARAGHYKIVKLLLAQESVDPISKDKFGKTPLYSAAKAGHYKIVKLLLAKGVDLDSKNKDGQTPLYVAAETGHYEIVKLLLAEGVNPNSKDKDGRTPLSVAARGSHYQAMELLLAKEGVDPDSKDVNDRTPLSWAAGSGSTFGNYSVMCSRSRVISGLLAQDHVNADSKDKDGRTPLSYAAAVRGSHEAVSVRVLLQVARERVDVNSQDSNGRTPLWYAAQSGNVESVKVLIAADGINLNSTDNDGQTALTVAIEERDNPVKDEWRFWPRDLRRQKELLEKYNEVVQVLSSAMMT